MRGAGSADTRSRARSTRAGKAPAAIVTLPLGTKPTWAIEVPSRTMPIRKSTDILSVISVRTCQTLRSVVFVDTWAMGVTSVPRSLSGQAASFARTFSTKAWARAAGMEPTVSVRPNWSGSLAPGITK